MILLLPAIACIVVSYVLLRFLIARSYQVGLIDSPNERSSHTVPTPRGGGVAFVITFAGALGLSAIFTDLPPRILLSLIPAFAIALLGLLDDRFSLRASIRLGVQGLSALASLIILFWPLPSLSGFPGLEFVTFLLGLFLAIIWMTNLYNFMDGIDGYAAVEAVVAGMGLAGLLALHRVTSEALVYVLFSSAIAGFLILNWSPAKIFMGDAGSTFIGFFFAVMAIATTNGSGLPLETSLIVLGTFIVDSTYTLTVRLFAGKKVHVAHRDHAYQHAVQMGWSHAKTVCVFTAITVLWLFPLAFLVSVISSWQVRPFVVVVAYVPLIMLQLWFRAGTSSLPKVNREKLPA